MARVRESRPPRRARRAPSPYVTLDRSLCDACWECVAACPKGVIQKIDVWGHHHAVIRDGDSCTGCMSCIKVCAAGALAATATEP